MATVPVQEHQNFDGTYSINSHTRIYLRDGNLLNLALFHITKVQIHLNMANASKKQQTFNCLGFDHKFHSALLTSKINTNSINKKKTLTKKTLINGITAAV